MKRHYEKSLSALVDGELRGVRRWLVERHVRRCPKCAAEYRHFHHVQQMLASNPPAVEMSDSAEFFWSKVKAEIEHRGSRRVAARMPHLSLWDWMTRHQYAMATVTAACVAAFVAVATWQARRETGFTGQHYARIETLETMIPDTVATVVDTSDPAVQTIWISGLPWTSDMEEMKSLFDTTQDADNMDT